MIDLSRLTTETRNPESMDLDEMTPQELVELMNREDRHVVDAVREVTSEIARAVELATEALKCEGRIFYIGAGTSGRLGVLDAAECPPTFGVSPDRVIGLIAGGESAFLKAVEGAEDSKELCRRELEKYHVCDKDLVIGLAASGRTPYVIYGLRFAKSIGCRTIAIACNKDSEIGQEADVKIEAVTGPEVLTGSTRLKAGTAQKMILNMISTGAMVGIGKVYQNLMIDVQKTNEKLEVRAQNITMEATGCDREEAVRMLEKAEGNVKTAIIMILLACDKKEAEQRLLKADGKVRTALNHK